MDLDDFLAAATPRTVTVKVCAAGELAARHQTLVAEWQKALSDTKGRSLGGDPLALDLAQQIVDLEDEMEGFTKAFTFRALSRNAWLDLVGEHPPTKAEREQGETVHPRTFAVAAIAACSVDPKITLEQARVMADTVSPGEWQKCWFAIVDLNTSPTSVPKMIAATAILQASEGSSTTSDPGASPDQRSLAGSGDPEPTTTTTPTAA